MSKYHKILDVVNYKQYAEEALEYGESYMPIPESIKLNDIQRSIHRYAGKGKLRTFENANDQLAIVKISDAVIDCPEIATCKTLPKSIPYEFKVGDYGFTNCGEPYVVIQKKQDGSLLVNVKSHGRWKIGSRNPDGTCVKQYRNGYLYALKHPEQLLEPAKKMVKRTIYLNVYDDETCCHPTAADARLYAGKDIIAMALPVTFEYEVEN